MSPVPGMLEIVKDAVFDTLFVPDNLRNGKGYVFCIPVGQYAGRRVKAYEDTSMLLAGCLPSPQKFLIKSFHCYLFDPDGGLIPLTDRAWDGTFALEISYKRMAEFSLREIADDDIRHKIAARTRDQKYYNLQELEDPASQQEISEFEAIVSGKMRHREDLFLIETCEAFVGRVFFNNQIKVPLEAIFALNGICGRAVC